MQPTAFGELMGFNSPYEMGRSFYKYGSAGVWTTFTFAGASQDTRSGPYEEKGGEVEVYYESGEGRKTWTQWELEGAVDLVAVTIGSIVEGSDAEATPITVEIKEGQSPQEVKENIYAAFEEVEAEVDILWHQANGESEEI